MDRKEILIRRLFLCHRELGFREFAAEFNAHREMKRLFPNPGDRTRQLRGHWQELAEEEYPAFRDDCASMDAVEITVQLKALQRWLSQPFPTGIKDRAPKKLLSGPSHG